MSPYLAFTLDSVVRGALIVAVVAVVALGARWERNQILATRKYLARLDERSKRAPEDILWIAFRERAAERALRIAADRQAVDADASPEGAVA